MIRQIDGYHIAAEIRLLRQVHKGAILMLEGQTDAKVFDRFIDSAGCTTTVCFGKPNLVKALDLLEDGGFAGVMGYADLDYDEILGITYALENLYRSECHDLDLTLFLSDAFVVYLSEHADKSRYLSNFDSKPELVRKAVFDTCETLGYCRLVSERHQLRLDFKDLRLDRFIDETNLSVNTDGLLGEILTRSRCAHNLNDLKALINIEKANTHPHEKIVNGHDASEVFGISLRQLVATRKALQTWGSEIEAGLRIALDWAIFRQTSCYSDLRDWEKRNAAYHIFPA